MGEAPYFKLNRLGTYFVFLLGEWNALFCTIHHGFIKLLMYETVNLSLLLLQYKSLWHGIRCIADAH